MLRVLYYALAIFCFLIVGVSLYGCNGGEELIPMSYERHCPQCDFGGAK